jgi:hypothetical protein
MSYDLSEYHPLTRPLMICVTADPETLSTAELPVSEDELHIYALVRDAVLRMDVRLRTDPTSSGQTAQTYDQAVLKDIRSTDVADHLLEGAADLLAWSRELGSLLLAS